MQGSRQQEDFSGSLCRLSDDQAATKVQSLPMPHVSSWILTLHGQSQAVVRIDL